MYANVYDVRRVDMVFDFNDVTYAIDSSKFYFDIILLTFSLRRKIFLCDLISSTLSQYIHYVMISDFFFWGGGSRNPQKIQTLLMDTPDYKKGHLLNNPKQNTVPLSFKIFYSHPYFNLMNFGKISTIKFIWKSIL